MNTILVVDDEQHIRESLEMILLYQKYNVLIAANAKEALSILKENSGIDIAILDIKMPGMDGLELLDQIKLLYPSIGVIMISGHAEIQTAVEATKKGAFDFLEKPLDEDRILITIRNALKNTNLKSKYQNLKKIISEERQLLGQSSQMNAIFKTINQVAPTSARVLITGENGTGKELVARAIHDNSERSEGAFIAVNCAAIPETLIESELFGHEKGAFTNAYEARKGKFEQADKGTIFLDEIGDMSLAAQAKVLRVLEENSIEKVGGNKNISIDVRVIAATNKNLDEECKNGNFREDLFYRLNVVPVHLSPLRERKQDIEILASHFLLQFSKKYNIPVKNISDDGIKELQRYPWQGNVRELKNLVERLVILSGGRTITEEDIKNYLPSQSLKIEGLIGVCETFEDFKRESEKIFLFHKLVEANWNVKKTAENLNMQRSNLYKKIEKYGLTKPQKYLRQEEKSVFQ